MLLIRFGGGASVVALWRILSHMFCKNLMDSVESENARDHRS